MPEICPVCKSLVPGDSRYCPVCGLEIHPDVPDTKKIQGSRKMELYRQGVDYLQKGQYRTALTYLNEVVRSYPHVARFWNSLGVCQYTSGMRDEARHSFEQAVALSPGTVIYRRNLEKTAKTLPARRLIPGVAKKSLPLKYGVLTISVLIGVAVLMVALGPSFQGPRTGAGVDENNSYSNGSFSETDTIAKIVQSGGNVSLCDPGLPEGCDDRVKDLFDRLETTGMKPCVMVGVTSPGISSVRDLGSPWILVESAQGDAEVLPSGTARLLDNDARITGFAIGTPEELAHMRVLVQGVDNRSKALDEALIEYNETVLYGSGTSLYWYGTDLDSIIDREESVVREREKAVADASGALEDFLGPRSRNVTVSFPPADTVLIHPSSSQVQDHDRQRAYALLHKSMQSICQGDAPGAQNAMDGILEVVAPLSPEERTFFQDAIVFVNSLTDSTRLTDERATPWDTSLSAQRDNLARASGSVKNAERILPLLNASGYLGPEDRDLLAGSLSKTRGRICEKAEQWHVPFYSPECSAGPAGMD